MIKSAPIYSATACATVSVIIGFLNTGTSFLYDDVIGFGLTVIVFCLYWLLGFVFSLILIPLIDFFSMALTNKRPFWLYILLGLVTPIPFTYAMIEVLTHAHGAAHESFSADEVLKFVSHSTCGLAAGGAAWVVHRRERS